MCLSVCFVLLCNDNNATDIKSTINDNNSPIINEPRQIVDFSLKVYFLKWINLFSNNNIILDT